MQKLTKAEAETLQHLETKIERLKKSTIEMAEALRQIRDQKLYRASYGSFREYVSIRWGLAVSRAYQLIDSLGVIEAIGDEIPETHARELIRANKSDWEAIHDEVIEKCERHGRKPTAGDYRESVLARPMRQMARTGKAPSCSNPITSVSHGRRASNTSSSACQFYAAAETMRESISVERRPSVLESFASKLGELYDLIEKSQKGVAVNLD